MSKTRTVSSPSQDGSGAVFKWIAVITVIIAVIGAMVFFAVNKSKNEGSFNMAKYDVPENLTVKLVNDPENGDTIQLRTSTNGNNKLTVYSDPQCPVCAQFEHLSHEDVTKELEKGNLGYDLHLLTFMDSNRGNTTSTEVSAALHTLARNEEAEPFFKMISAWWASEIDSNGAYVNTQMSRKQLAQAASDAGASEKSVKEIEDGTNIQVADDAYKTNADLLKNTYGSVSTPSIIVDGTKASKLGLDGAEEGQPYLIKDINNWDASLIKD